MVYSHFFASQNIGFITFPKFALLVRLEGGDVWQGVQQSHHVWPMYICHNRGPRHMLWALSRKANPWNKIQVELATRWDRKSFFLKYKTSLNKIQVVRRPKNSWIRVQSPAYFLYILRVRVHSTFCNRNGEIRTLFFVHTNRHSLRHGSKASLFAKRSYNYIMFLLKCALWGE